MFKKSIAILVIVSLFVITANANAATMAYMYLKGQKTGDIKGSIIQKGRENSIGVIAFEQATKIETSVASGIASGRVSIGQIIITKEVDKSSPILRNMLLNMEVITDARIVFTTPTASGTVIEYYMVRLTNARIVSMKTVMANIRNPELGKLLMYEEVTFAYQRADWTWPDGGITTSEVR
jgi:type VI secretion system secreted protein Hcp